MKKQREQPKPTHQQWLNKVIEDVVDPDTPIVDCHHHFYKDRDSYFAHQPTYVAEHLAEDLNDGHKVIATVGVECGYGYRSNGPESLRSLGETEFMLECAEDYRSHGTHTTAVCKGVIPFVDLRLGDAVEEVFLAQRDMAGERFVGIRQLAAKKLAEKGLENTDSLLLDKNFQRGFSHLARHNLTFDAWILHPQIPEVFELAKKFPDTTIVLDHFGAPLGIGPYANHRDHVMATWRKDMQQLSELHNVVVKIGGLNMSLNGYDWHLQPAPPTSDDLLAATRDYYLRTIDMFGPDRCLFESNFPVDKLSVSYRTLWNAYKKIAREFTKVEAAGMLAGNAQRVYRLD